MMGGSPIFPSQAKFLDPFPAPRIRLYFGVPPPWSSSRIPVFRMLMWCFRMRRAPPPRRCAWCLQGEGKEGSHPTFVPTYLLEAHRPILCVFNFRSISSYLKIYSYRLYQQFELWLNGIDTIGLYACFLSLFFLGKNQNRQQGGRFATFCDKKKITWKFRYTAKHSVWYCSNGDLRTGDVIDSK